MNYDEMQESFGPLRYAVFSNWDRGDGKGYDWKSPKAFKNDYADRVAFEGTHRVYYEGWGGEHSETLTNPTLKDIMQFFERAILSTGDKHHIYYENLYRREKDGEIFYEVIAGS